MDKHETLPSILYIIWPMHLQSLKSSAMSDGLWGNAFTRNIWWSIALYIMWPMYLQSLKLLQPMVKEMHYQENTLFDIDPKVKEVKVTHNVAQ